MRGLSNNYVLRNICHEVVKGTLTSISCNHSPSAAVSGGVAVPFQPLTYGQGDSQGDSHAEGMGTAIGAVIAQGQSEGLK
jgi:hypothetical protein